MDEIELKYDDPLKQGAPNEKRFEELLGRVRVVSSVPSWKPRARLDDSIALYVNGTICTLYVYDTLSSQWRAVGASSSYAGIVDDTGSGIILPSGWTSTTTGTGHFTVTHNLGHTNYSIVVTVKGLCVIALDGAPDSTSFSYLITEITGAAADRVVHFNLTLT